MLGKLMIHALLLKFVELWHNYNFVKLQLPDVMVLIKIIYTLLLLLLRVVFIILGKFCNSLQYDINELQIKTFGQICVQRLRDCIIFGHF